MRIYEKLAQGRVECRACNHFCKINNGKVGICGVRQNVGGKLKLLVDGRSPAYGVDPIEKKPLYHFLPGSKIFSLGTYGCNFKCKNCLNWQLSQIDEMKGKLDVYGDINWGDELEPKRIVKLALKNKCKSIAYTYNEPTVFIEYALETMKMARRKGLKNVWVSNGYFSDKTFKAIVPYLDAVNVDIKSMDNEFYREVCGAKLNPVLENCKKLVKAGVWLEVTTLIIPKLSDDMKMLKKLARFIKNELGENVPWHVSKFSADISWKLRDYPNTKEALVEEVCKTGKNVGLRYVYSGNIRGNNFSNTICWNCSEVLVNRDGYMVNMFIKGGKCKFCSKNIKDLVLV